MRRGMFFALVFLLAVPAGAHAAPRPLEVGGWIPYWRTASGTLDVLPHLSQLTHVSPFVLTLKKDGTIADNGAMGEEPWASFIAQAKKQNVRVIPTVMSGDAATIHAILSNTRSRIALEDRIADLVREQGWDGIDIDFEGKRAETRPYFSTFLMGLYWRMGPKWVYCSIEARTPLADRFETPPATIEYANDLSAINRYCDRVQIMTYDQGTIDLTLNRARAAPYIPVADPAWVEKAVALMAQSISKKKILIGVATYGYEYSVKPLSPGGYRYERQWAFNPRYATELATRLGLAPVRNAAGELSFAYTQYPTSTPAAIAGDPTSTLTNNNDPNLAGPGAALYTQAALASQAAPPFSVVWWSDAQAIADKITVAQKLGVRGIAVFKFDGGEDQAVWNLFPALR